MGKMTQEQMALAIQMISVIMPDKHILLIVADDKDGKVFTSGSSGMNADDALTILESSLRGCLMAVADEEIEAYLGRKVRASHADK